MMCFCQAAWHGFLLTLGRQAAWLHGAVAVELLGGDCKVLGLCFAWGMNKQCPSVELLGGWAN